MANEVITFLKFIGGYALPEAPTAVLDTQIWVGEGGQITKSFETESKDLIAPETGDPRRQILYSFYNKPMADKITMLTTSAIQENTKVATVSEEIHRRLKRSLMA